MPEIKPVDVMSLNDENVPGVRRLGELFCSGRSAGECVAWSGAQKVAAPGITFGQFQQDVAALIAVLAAGDNEGKKWALYCEDSYRFLVGLIALLHSNITPVLPMNIQSGVIEALARRVDGFVSDSDVLSSQVALGIENNTLPVVTLPLSAVKSLSSEESMKLQSAIDFSARTIEIYTSGSTGDPEVIVKKIGQFEEEVITLERCWGDSLGMVAYVATVSHQHIYGLLFRLLWPVCTGRIFFSTRFEFPESMAAAIKKFKESEGGRVVMVSSPAHIKRVSENAGLTNIGLYGPVTFSSGGPLAFDANMHYQSITGSQVTEVFGSSETGGIAWRSLREGVIESDDNLGWIPFEGVELSLVDGLLEVKSKHCVASDDAFQMADKVEFLGDGRFLLRGRADRIAKIEEKRVSLSGVEALLLKHDWLSDAKVVVLEGRRQCLGVVACLSTEGDETLVLLNKRVVVDVLKEYLSTVFEPVILPRKWRFVSAMPINAQGKTVVSDLCLLFDNAEIKDEK